MGCGGGVVGVGLGRGGVGGQEVGRVTRRVASLLLRVWSCLEMRESCADADFEPKLKASAIQRKRSKRTPMPETDAAALSPLLPPARLFALMLRPTPCRQPTLPPIQWKLCFEVVKNLPPSILRMRDSDDKKKLTLEFPMQAPPKKNPRSCNVAQ